MEQAAPNPPPRRSTPRWLVTLSWCCFLGCSAAEGETVDPVAASSETSDTGLPDSPSQQHDAASASAASTPAQDQAPSVQPSSPGSAGSGGTPSEPSSSVGGTPASVPTAGDDPQTARPALPPGSFTALIDGGCAIGNEGRLACWGYMEPPWVVPTGQFIAVTGYGYGCALRDNGELACFQAGSLGTDLSEVPAGTFGQVAGSRQGYCALDAEGLATCVGATEEPEAGLFERIGVGESFTCAIRKNDGTLVCKGYPSACSVSDLGQLDPPAGTFIELAVSGWHACAIRVDNELLCWGMGNVTPEVQGRWLECEEPDYPSTVSQGQSTPPAGKYQHVSISEYHGCAVRIDGTVACWGAGTAVGECGSGAFDCGQSIPPEGTFDQVSVSAFHSCGMRADRTLSCWGGGNLILQTPADFP